MADIARLRYQCRRGMLELDAILQPFFEKHFQTLSVEQQQAFEQLLTYPDPVIYACLLGFEQIDDPKLTEIVQTIRRF